eukprot:scaffold84458_cov39-Phaeocystis_antarctica.AAC.1
MAWIRMDATGMGEIPGVVTGRAQPAGSAVLAVPATAQYPRPLGLPPVPQAPSTPGRPQASSYRRCRVAYGCRASLLLTYGCRLFAFFLLALLWKNQYMKASSLTTCYLLAYCLLRTAYYLLLTSHCLLLTSRRASSSQTSIGPRATSA